MSQNRWWWVQNMASLHYFRLIVPQFRPHCLEHRTNWFEWHDASISSTDVPLWSAMISFQLLLLMLFWILWRNFVIKVTILFHCVSLLLDVYQKLFFVKNFPWRIWICCKDNYAYWFGVCFTNAKTSPNSDLGLIFGRVCFTKLETQSIVNFGPICNTYPPSLVAKYRDMGKLCFLLQNFELRNFSLKVFRHWNASALGENVGKKSQNSRSNSLYVTL